MDEKPLAWEELQTFLAAARAGTLSGAAKLLDTSAATVLRRLRVLETSMTTSLFARSPRGYALTSAGADLFEHVQAMEAQVLAAQRRLGGRDQRLSGTIRVATVDDVVQAVLAPILAGFSQRHPALSMDLLVDSEYTDLARRTADVAIRAGLQPQAGDVIAKRVCTIGVALYASREYLRRQPMRPSLETLSSDRIVRGDEARGHIPMEKLVDRHVDGAAIALRSNSMLARAAAVRDGLGIGMLPCFVADTERELVRLGDVLSDASAALWILVYPDMRRNARVRAFVDYTYSELLRQQDRIAGEA